MKFSFRSKVIGIFISFLLLFTISSHGKEASRVKSLENIKPKSILPKGASTSISALDTCAVYEGGDPAWLVYPWVEGNELFKVYQNPSATCTNPYPFSINQVHLILYCVDIGILHLSADIEAVDNSVPGCPHPGEMLDITPLYQYVIPAEDLYFITVPLDSPVVVEGPFFVGLYIAFSGNPQIAAIVTDDTPVGCVSYNDWGYGYVDLDTVYTNPDGTGPIKTFPGRMILYSSGFPGGNSGGGTDPPPVAEFISPQPNDDVGSGVDLWVNDISGSSIIARADFYYQQTGSWIYLATDKDDDPPLRNGIISSGLGNGLSYYWNTTDLPEEDYQVRAVLTDTLGQADTAQITIHIDPTPPIPNFINPLMGHNVSGNIDVELTCPDENLSYMTFSGRSKPIDNTLAIPIINQNLGGDTNGNQFDGNSSASGEFGDFCSGPAVAAMALKYWSHQGYSDITREGFTDLTDDQLMQRLFSAMRVEENMGTYDGEFIAGINEYILSHGGGFSVKANRNPGIADIYDWGLNNEYTTMLGLSGNPGLWLILAGNKGVARHNEDHTLTLIDPVTATISDYTIHELYGILTLNYNSIWYEVDIIVSLYPDDWNLPRNGYGYDGNDSDGWGMVWNTSTLEPNKLHFLTAQATDTDNNSWITSVPVRNDGAQSYIPGDVNDDGFVNPGDLIYLINYVYLHSAPPPAGNEAANINGDSTIDLADVIYLYNYLFLGGPTPK
ncbi:MAG: dockerin type I repeat-containing protein [candidate division Zixibacteria bacterium]